MILSAKYKIQSRFYDSFSFTILLNYIKTLAFNELPQE